MNWIILILGNIIDDGDNNDVAENDDDIVDDVGYTGD